MSLPNVNIRFGNGALGGVAPMDDGVVGLLATASAVSSTFSLGTAYLLTKLDDLVALGIDSESSGANANLYKCVKDFYSQAPDGTKLWLMGVPDTVTMPNMLDMSQTTAYGKNLVEAANGAIRILMVKVTDSPSYSPSIEYGLDEGVFIAADKAQELAGYATDNLYAPLIVVLEGRHYSGTASQLADLSEGEWDRVAIVIGDTVSGSAGAAVGLLCGRLAAIPVQRSAARVRDGAVATMMYIGSTAAELAHPDLVHDAGFICPRTFVGRSGYYWSDDKMAVSPESDYSLIPYRRVIDKAYRVVYARLLDTLNDEMLTAKDGAILPAIARSIEADVASAIIAQMGSEGNISSDPNDPKDTGVRVEVDTTQNIISTSTLNIAVGIRPYGYAKYIDVVLGFFVER